MHTLFPFEQGPTIPINKDHYFNEECNILRYLKNKNPKDKNL